METIEFLLEHDMVKDKHGNTLGRLTACPFFVDENSVKEIKKYAYIPVKLVGETSLDSTNSGIAYVYIHDVFWYTEARPWRKQYKYCIKSRYPAHTCTGVILDHYYIYTRSLLDPGFKMFEPCITNQAHIGIKRYNTDTLPYGGKCTKPDEDQCMDID